MGDAPVVERALEPLHARGAQRVLVQHGEVPRERADALGAHRVALVGHRGGADLRGLERLFDLLRGASKTRIRDGDGGECDEENAKRP